jgi:Bacterial dnaA protein helix-turn-helix
MNALDLAVLRARTCKVIPAVSPPPEPPPEPPAQAPGPFVAQFVEVIDSPFKIERPPPIAKPVAHRFILYTVAETFGVTKSELIGPRRIPAHVLPRQVAMYLMREILKFSATKIGVVFGRDHSTAVHAYQKIQRVCRTDRELRDTIDALEDHIRYRLGRPKGMIFRYVVHARVDDYLKLGWLATPALEGTYHGYWSVLMRWICPSCPPIEPRDQV